MRKSQLQAHHYGQNQRNQTNADCCNGILHSDHLGILAPNVFTDPGFRVIKLHLPNFGGWSKIHCIMGGL